MPEVTCEEKDLPHYDVHCQDPALLLVSDSCDFSNTSYVRSLETLAPDEI